MKTRPILMSAPMVRAILTGRKTQTRRVVKNPEYFGCLTGDCHHWQQSECDGAMATQSPYGVVGDRLWVKETWACHGHAPGLVRGNTVPQIVYRADLCMHTFATLILKKLPKVELNRWTPSIFMPKWASRIELEIVSVRVQHLCDLSEKDAFAEGAHRKMWITSPMSAGALGARGKMGTHKEGFEEIWKNINGPGSWAANPWVWVVNFKRV